MISRPLLISILFAVFMGGLLIEALIFRWKHPAGPKTATRNRVSSG